MRWAKYKYARSIGKKHVAEYKTFTEAKCRCTNPKHRDYKNYGGRGIKFLFESFDQFMDEVGYKPPGLELDRIENDGHYAPGNVRWTTSKVNNNNRRAKENT